MCIKLCFIKLINKLVDWRNDIKSQRRLFYNIECARLFFGFLRLKKNTKKQFTRVPSCIIAYVNSTKDSGEVSVPRTSRSQKFTVNVQSSFTTTFPIKPSRFTKHQAPHRGVRILGIIYAHKDNPLRCVYSMIRTSVHAF